MGVFRRCSETAGRGALDLRLRRRRRSGPDLGEEDRRHSREDRATRRERQFLGACGGEWGVRAVFGALYRPRRGTRMRETGLCRRVRLRSLPGVLEPGLSAIRPGPGRKPFAAPEPGSGHGHGVGTSRAGRAGRRKQLRNRSFRPDHRNGKRFCSRDRHRKRRRPGGGPDRRRSRARPRLLNQRGDPSRE